MRKQPSTILEELQYSMPEKRKTNLQKKLQREHVKEGKKFRRMWVIKNQKKISRRDQSTMSNTLNKSDTISNSLNWPFEEDRDHQ